MEFTNEQKLIVALLTEIHAKLDIEDGLDPLFIQNHVINDRTWAIRWRYGHLFDDGYENPRDVKFVVEVLNLWERIEHSYSKFSDREKAQLIEFSPIFGKAVSFIGFDGNGGDRDGYGIADTLINDLGRWKRFKDRELNSHSQMADVYQRMLDAFNLFEKPSNEYELTVEELAEVINAKTHPSMR